MHKDRIAIVDEYDRDIGVTTREVAHREGLLHRIAVVYLYNKKGQILVQERMDGKHDHSSAGHVDVGESYSDAAKRELQEELGVDGVELEEIGTTFSDEQNFHPPTFIRHIYKIYQSILLYCTHNIAL